jgi:hypothetical protein
MRALVVYESMFGSTAAIAEAVATSLRDNGLDAKARPISKTEPAEAGGIDLLIVGGPTHRHGLSSSKSRQAAAGDAKNTFPEPTLEPGLRDWLKQLPPRGGQLGAAFDTRFNLSMIVTGSAAKGIARRLEERGDPLVIQPESFFVSKEHQLLDGELEHAARWGAEVAKRSAASST